MAFSYSFSLSVVSFFYSFRLAVNESENVRFYSHFVCVGAVDVCVCACLCVCVYVCVSVSVRLSFCMDVCEQKLPHHDVQIAAFHSIKTPFKILDFITFIKRSEMSILTAHVINMCEDAE